MIFILDNITFYFLLANIENGLKMVLDTETCSLWILEPKNKCAEGLNKYIYNIQDAYIHFIKLSPNLCTL
jgi:hypothetical protein